MHNKTISSLNLNQNIICFQFCVFTNYNYIFFIITVMNCISKQMIFFIALLFIIIGLMLFSGSLITKNSEKQEFIILKKITINSGDIEIRQYPRMIFLQTLCNEGEKESKKLSFKILANYIFGGNKKQMKIAMTIPVIEKTNKDSEKCTMNFIVPKEYKLDDLPEPMTDKINIIEEQEKTYISITFSGNKTEKSTKKHLDILMQYCKDNHLQINEDPLILGYNPPWTVSFLKTNEILLEITDIKNAQI